jgi:endoribonuclease Dicer
MMLVDSIDLNMAIAGYVPILQSYSAENIVKTGWKFDPPKALSDVFESLTGAIFIDSGYDYDKTAAVVEHVMEGVLEVLSPALAKDPISALMEWGAAQGCRKVTIGYVFVNAF